MLTFYPCMLHVSNTLYAIFIMLQECYDNSYLSVNYTIKNNLLHTVYNSINKTYNKQISKHIIVVKLSSSKQYLFLSLGQNFFLQQKGKLWYLSATGDPSYIHLPRRQEKKNRSGPQMLSKVISILTYSYTVQQSKQDRPYFCELLPGQVEKQSGQHSTDTP